MSEEIEWAECPECGHEQPDMGNAVACEECGGGPVVKKLTSGGKS